MRRGVRYLRALQRRTLDGIAEALLAVHSRVAPVLGLAPAIVHAANRSQTAVDRYWGRHTVNSKPFWSPRQSEGYLEWRFFKYPLLREFMGLYGGYEDEVILDYGCGPGDDLTGFALYSKARRVIGVDVSMRALRLAQHRLRLHRVDPRRITLIRTSDLDAAIPLENESVDYVHCAGVLHHTSHPERLLREFYRVMRRDGRGCIMVYNYNSLWMHLYTAYERMIVQSRFSGMSAREAFARSTDGERCPIARCYTPEEFGALCEAAGFGSVEYVGGYLSETELDLLKTKRSVALQDDRLNGEHRAFLDALEFDDRGWPRYEGKYAGVGGVYRLGKRTENQEPANRG